MIVDDLLKNPGAWLSRDAGTDVVLSSRVRLARNVHDMPFPTQARQEECVRVRDRIRSACETASRLSGPSFLDMGALDPLDKMVLKERRLISHELAEKGEGSGLIVSSDECTALMVNEEDHLRLQGISTGDNIEAVWRRVDAVDTQLEALITYAVSPRLGYLTSCPSNVGTGLRASVMLHLPGLQLTGEADAVVRGLSRIGLAVRGLFGEGSDACGNMYQVSNQRTLGQTEQAIMAFLQDVVGEVVQHEHHARARLMENRSSRTVVYDRIGRAFGILSHARTISSGELVELLSLLRLGVEFDLVSGIGVATINELLLTTQPGHLQKMAGRMLSPTERDEVRGDVGRQRLADVQYRAD